MNQIKNLFPNNPVFQRITMELEPIIANCQWIFLGEFNGKYTYVPVGEPIFKDYRQRFEFPDVPGVIEKDTLFTTNEPIANAYSMADYDLKREFTHFSYGFDKVDGQWEMKYIGEKHLENITFYKLGIEMVDYENSPVFPSPTMECGNDVKCRQKGEQLEKFFLEAIAVNQGNDYDERFVGLDLEGLQEDWD